MSLSDFSALQIVAEAEALSLKLKAMYEGIIHPFPYNDVRHIYKTVTSRKKLTRRVIDNFLVGDLDTYFSAISGAGSWGKKALEWSPEKRQRIAEYLSKDFFERYPKYLPVQRWITEVDTPELHRDFVLHEEMRVNVLALISLLDKLEGH